MNKLLRAVVTVLLAAVIIISIAAAGGLIYLSMNEYNPENTENVEVFGTTVRDVLPGDTVKLMTYNAGFCAEDNEHDGYRDGGSTVITEAQSNIENNIDGITSVVESQSPDAVLFQEIDIASKRSYYLDEASIFSGNIEGTSNAFAADIICKYVPFPLTSEGAGQVESGMLSLTNFHIDSAERRVLANDNGWPVSTWSRKPGLLVERVKLGDTTKELVIINLNFEKYDDGTVRKSQYKTLCEFMQLEYAKGNYVIAGGCFNCALPSVAKDKYSQEADSVFTQVELSTENLTGGWKYCTDDSTPTMRLMNEAFSGSESSARLYVVDGFITSPNTIVEKTATVDTDFRYSSHNPVTAEITLVK